MIETYKLLNNIYDKNTTNFLLTKQQTTNRISPRGHELQLAHQRSTTKLRQNNFSIRIINTWNSLTNEIVTAPTLNTFKNRLDKHWRNQNVLYNHKTALDLGMKWDAHTEP